MYVHNVYCLYVHEYLSICIHSNIQHIYAMHVLYIILHIYTIYIYTHIINILHIYYTCHNTYLKTASPSYPPHPRLAYIIIIRITINH